MDRIATHGARRKWKGRRRQRALTLRAVVHYVARTSLAMAAISVSARDIEERLQAVQRRWRWRVRLHAGAYACSVALVGVAAAVWWGGAAVRTAPSGWLVMLVASLTVLGTLLASWPVERSIDRERTAAWIDSRAGLAQRFSTFVSIPPEAQRSRLFPVLVLQLVRARSQYEPRQLIPWKPTKPLAALGAASLVLVLAWRHAEPAHPPPLAHRKTEPASNPERASQVAQGAGEAARSREPAEHEAAVEEGTETAESLAAGDAAMKRASTRERAVRAGQDSQGAGGPLPGARSSSRQGPESRRAAAGTAEGSGSGEGPRPRGDGVAPGGSPADAAALARGSAGGSSAALRPPQLAGNASELPEAAKPGADPQRRNAGPPAPQGQSPAKGQSGAGSGTDGTGLYGAAAPARRGESGAQSEPIVVTLPATTFVRRGVEPQGRGASGGQSLDAPEAAPVPSSGAAAPIEKPLLPEAYRELAQRVFARSAKP